MTDENLILKIKNGEKEYFNELIKKYYKRIYYSVLKMISSHEEAEEVTQEVFMIAMEKINSFRMESSFYTWIYKIALNKIKYIHRKNSILKFFHIGDYEKKLKEEEKKYDNELFYLIDLFINNLNYRDKSIIIMYFFEKMTLKEISTVLGKSESTIKTQFYSVLEKFKKYLKEKGYDGYEF